MYVHSSLQHTSQHLAYVLIGSLPPNIKYHKTSWVLCLCGKIFLNPHYVNQFRELGYTFSPKNFLTLIGILPGWIALPLYILFSASFTSNSQILQ